MSEDERLERDIHELALRYIECAKEAPERPMEALVHEVKYKELEQRGYSKDVIETKVLQRLEKLHQIRQLLIATLEAQVEAKVELGATALRETEKLEKRVVQLESAIHDQKARPTSKRLQEPEPPEAEHVGIILVHGIGEQRRFQHLDGELREILRALRTEMAREDPGSDVSVDLPGASAAAFHAEQDTWSAGPHASVRIVVKKGSAGPGGKQVSPKSEIHLHVHEVWWADVNEPYSLGKQFRFWLWGLSVWRYPAKMASGLASTNAVMPPTTADGWWPMTWTRLRLFLVGVVFALLGFSIGTLTFLAKRLFGVEPPALLEVITNYVSGVKLYNQRRRFGAGLVPHEEEFIDTIGEPPRVSVRRRMIRTIADVACNGYDRWYVLAHSLGSVVAFNGLMETAWAWPGYLNRAEWHRLREHQLAGPHKPSWTAPTGETVPRRPVWVEPDGVAYRQGIFEHFRGILTYGCPLDKFAAIWPARVPISRERGFQTQGETKPVWINVFDPIDPVSGALDGFSTQPEHCCPHPHNIGYAASSVLLLSHIRYVRNTGPGRDLATAVVRWVLGTADAPGQGGNTMEAQFAEDSPRARRRSCGAWLTWIAAFVVLVMLAGVVVPLFVDALAALGGATWNGLARLFT